MHANLLAAIVGVVFSGGFHDHGSLSKEPNVSRKNTLTCAGSRLRVSCMTSSSSASIPSCSPTSTELYALKHNDITVETDPKRLLVTVRNGKTGYRVANTMSGAVSAYERIRARYSDAGGEDYIFLPEYTNRATASRIFQRQFNQLLDDTGLKHDPVTETERSVYCLRHTAICMRIILSQRQG